MSSATSELSPNDELWILTEQFVDETISPEGQLQLDARLLADQSARDFYLTCIELHARLAWLARGKTHPEAELHGTPQTIEDELPPLAADDPFEELLRAARPTQPTTILRSLTGNSHRRGEHFAAPLSQWRAALQQHSVAAFTTLVVALVLVGLWVANSWSSNPASLGSRPIFARLVAAKGCQWDESSPSIGEEIGSGSRRLLSGLAKIEFVDGAQLVIEGPSDFELRSASSMYLVQGRLLAQVPLRAIGFNVETSAAKIIDRGTEFVIEAIDGQTKVAVTKGAVDLIATAGNSQRLTARQAMEVARRGDQSTVARVPFEATWVNRAAQLDESFQNTTPTLEGVVAFQAIPAIVAGNQSDYRGVLGLDFEVIRPILVSSLGVFDSQGDGIHGKAKLIVQLWSRNTKGTIDDGDDEGEMDLVELTFTAEKPGIFKAGHRFKALPQPIELEPGSYSIVAYGFDASNPSFSFDVAHEGTASSQMETLQGAIAPAKSRRQDRMMPGVFPNVIAEQNRVSYFAGSFTYTSISSPSQKK